LRLDAAFRPGGCDCAACTVAYRLSATSVGAQF
jgi:hypothetical protein